MINIINEKLNSVMKEQRTIYVLKGFNSILSKLRINLYHLYDLDLSKNLENVLDQTYLNSKLTELISAINNPESKYCLLEELILLEKNSLMGLLSKFNIEIIDIGFFDCFYPGFVQESNKFCLTKFDEDTPETNNIQKIYSCFMLRNEVPIVCYNVAETNNIKEIVLFDTYNDVLGSDTLSEKYLEIFDNSTPDIFIDVFNKILLQGYNDIKYIVVEDKRTPAIKKFLSSISELGVNVQREKNVIDKKVGNYNQYLQILKRINSTYDFRNILVYKDPFKDNTKEEINQSVIIDTIYKNIEKAQKGESFKDIFVTAPTGAGKSILFQIPSILAAEKLKLLTIVISPLIGLMKDQVESIKALTDCARTINSEYTPFEKEKIKEEIKNNKCSIIYISPETLLSNSDITTFINDRKIGLLVIDEAHTVATWGKNFRPDYWYLGDYVDKLRHKLGYIFPIATFTATATIGNNMEDMYHDIVESLNMTSINFFGNVKRDNIKFDISIHKKDHAYAEEKEDISIKKIKSYIDSGDKTLVYFPYTKTLNSIYDKIPQTKVCKYYGTLDKLEKDESLKNIKSGLKTVVLATKAFGMGIDIKDIKYVYHFAPTGNLADYVQEIGRAARNPEMIGIASTDYFEEDFRYINKLHGMSQITNYNIIGVLQKILYKYRKEGKRNFLISASDFAYIFNAKDDEDIDSKLKATFIAIKKDFKYVNNYMPIIFKPSSMFTTGLFYIPDCKLGILKSYGWDRYIEKKYDRIELNKMSINSKSGLTKTTYMGDVYKFDLKKCWKDNYNGKCDGLTFGNFKRKFYLQELPNIDFTCLQERMTLFIESKHGETLGFVVENIIDCIDKLENVLDDMKMTNKHYKVNEISLMLHKKGINKDLTKLNNITETLINLLITYDSNSSFGYCKFAEYNSKTERYHIKSTYYKRALAHIKDAIKSHVHNYENEKSRVAIIDTSKNKKTQMRSDPLLIGVQIMELFNAISYSISSGDKPEYFIRVNSEIIIQNSLNNNYRSKTLASIQALHENSVRHMKYFFETLKTDQDRWEFIEYYFLGQTEKFINRKKIKIYNVFDKEYEGNNKYYINDIDIPEINDIGYIRISNMTEMAKNLIDLKVGENFEINEYEYILTSIEEITISK